MSGKIPGLARAPLPGNGTGVSTRRKRALSALVIAMFAATATAQIPAGAPPATPAVACRDFCAQLYGADTEKREKCVQGCAIAERCIDRCDDRFSADEEKRKQCHYRCARVR